MVSGYLSFVWHAGNARTVFCTKLLIIFCAQTPLNADSPVENQNDMELDFKVVFFVDSCC